MFERHSLGLAIVWGAILKWLHLFWVLAYKNWVDWIYPTYNLIIWQIGRWQMGAWHTRQPFSCHRFVHIICVFAILLNTFHFRIALYSTECKRKNGEDWDEKEQVWVHLHIEYIKHTEYVCIACRISNTQSAVANSGQSFELSAICKVGCDCSINLKCPINSCPRSRTECQGI